MLKASMRIFSQGSMSIVKTSVHESGCLFTRVSQRSLPRDPRKRCFQPICGLWVTRAERKLWA